MVLHLNEIALRFHEGFPHPSFVCLAAAHSNSISAQISSEPICKSAHSDLVLHLNEIALRFREGFPHPPFVYLTAANINFIPAQITSEPVCKSAHCSTTLSPQFDLSRSHKRIPAAAHDFLDRLLAPFWSFLLFSFRSSLPPGLAVAALVSEACAQEKISVPVTVTASTSNRYRVCCARMLWHKSVGMRNLIWNVIDDCLVMFCLATLKAWRLVHRWHLPVASTSWSAQVFTGFQRRPEV